MNVPAITSAITIGISWNPNEEDGGTQVIDYRVKYD